MAEPTQEKTAGMYWAASPKEIIGTEIADQLKNYYQIMSASGLFELYRVIHAMFYSLGPAGHEGSKIVEFGDNGEKLGVKSNQIRSLIRYILTSATADRPAVMPKAINSTAKAMMQVPVARKVLDYYNKTKRMERQLVGTALRALLYGKGYMWQSWDPSIGDTDQAPGQTSGDLIYRACSPMEVACDLERDAYDHDWFIITRPRNKYDLAATLGKKSEELRAKIIDTDTSCIDKNILQSINFGFKKLTKQSDVVYEHHFIHRKTPAMPNGRYVIMIGEDLVLFDDVLQYPDMPVSEMIPEEFLEAGSVGYASAWDLVGLQQSYDALISTCMTNFDALGHHDMLLPEGVELSVEVVRDGLNAIRFPAGEHNKPSILEKFSVKEEVFKLREWLKSDMEVNSGVNSVARGEPQNSLQTGPALALVQAQAVHFQTGFIGSFTQLIEDSATTSIRILKKYATVERIAAISGENDPDGLLAFSSKDIDQIDRVECDRGNPAFRTLAGKYDQAEKFLERGLIKNINEYYQVLDKGRLEPVMDPHTKANMQVLAENEILMKGPVPKPKLDPLTGMPAVDEMGQPVMYLEELPVVMTDDPMEHIQGHTMVLNSPENRRSKEIVTATTMHILDHFKVWRETPPDVLQLLGFPLPGMPGDPNAQPDEKGGDPLPGNGTQPKQKAPDEGSQLPSLPKAAKPPKQDNFGRPTA